MKSDVGRMSSEEKRALVHDLLRQRSSGEVLEYPASYGQRSLWFMHQLAPESSVYNVTNAWIIRSELDVAALQRAFQRLADRHAILRTTFAVRDGEPIQRVHPRLGIGFGVVTVPDHSDEAIRAEMIGRARRPFDLEAGPILRVDVFSRSATDHVVLVCLHHIACDMWSFELLLRELRVLYLAESAGRDAKLPTGRHQYADFATWQRRNLASAEGERLWTFWREHLSAPLPVLDLPIDRVRPPVLTYSGDAVVFDVRQDIVARLTEVARREGATLFTTVLAAFAVLLHRYCNQTDMLIGTPSLGRTRPEFEHVVGYFVNPIILRLNSDGNPTFREFLRRTRQTVLDAVDHQDLPFPLLVERLLGRRDPSRSPLSDVYFVWDRVRGDGSLARSESDPERVALDWGKLRLEAFPLAQVGTPSDIALLFIEVEGRVTGNFGYNTDLFDRTTIVRMAEQLTALLEAVCDHSDERILALPMTQDPAEMEPIRSPAPSGVPRLLSSTPIHANFEARVRERRTAPAVSCGDNALDYLELNHRADLLAHHLVASGVEPGSRVAIYLDRSLELVVSILGVLKAGAAYVPLDRAYPADRLRFIIGDASPDLVLSRRSLADEVPAGAVPVLCVDELPSRGSDRGLPLPDVSAEDVAYVIYTSGSTGQPKGVMVTHRNVVRLFASTEAWFGFDHHDVWTLFHSCAFDFSVWEVFGALLYGGRLVVVPHGVTRSPAEFHDLLCREKVTVLNQTPSAFAQLIEADARRPDAQLNLRLVVFGGEALDPTVLTRWCQRHGTERPRLVNMYGITETTVHVTYRPITLEDVERSSGSPIGVPIPDLYLRVLDASLQPVPVGIVGELLVGGAGVARGYLNRPELSAARFIRDPLSDEPHERLYRTGDLVRRTGSGDLLYVGRADQQVKIRGFRIELGEVESVIKSHPLVRECVVLPKAYAPGDVRLVAYCVPSVGRRLDMSSLQRYVRDRLPEYMVPAGVVELDRIPLTEHGKIDRAALPDPERSDFGSPSGSEPPRTELERELAAMWGEMLALPDLGVHDDFFMLGGHSMLVTQILFRVRERYGVEVPVRSFMQAPTIAGLAESVELRRIVDDGSSTATLPSAEPRDEMDI